MVGEEFTQDVKVHFSVETIENCLMCGHPDSRHRFEECESLAAVRQPCPHIIGRSCRAGQDSTRCGPYPPAFGGILPRPSELPRKALICWRLGWHHHPRRSHALQRSKDLLCCWNSPVLPSTHWMALPADFCGILQTGVLVLPQTLHGRFFQHKTGSGGLCLLPPGLRILSWASLDS